MPKTTKQMSSWSGDFGKEYTERNMQTVEEMEEMYRKNFGKSRTEINSSMIGPLDRSLKVLEVGSNIGNQLLCLQNMGFKDLYGIEIQKDAVEICKNRTQYINVIQASAFDIPYKDKYFDLVFTAGVLIHISPKDIKDVISEIYRVSRKYIWGMEYFAPEYTEVEYRGNKDLLWKTDFAKLYLDTFKDLKLVKEQKFKYAGSDNVDTMYLLEKK